MEARIREEFPGAEVELVESSGGAFEVMVDSRLVYSKKATGRHVEWDELAELLRASP